MRAYLLILSCVSGDEVRIAIRRREHIVSWLRRLDHGGAQWSVVQPVYDGHRRTQTRNLTAEIEAEYRGTGDLTARIDQAYRAWRTHRYGDTAAAGGGRR